MTTIQLLNEVPGAEAVKFQNLLCPLSDEAESTSICPLLTPSPSDPNMSCTSPDPIIPLPDPESASICPLLTPSGQPDNFHHPLDPIAGINFEAKINLDNELPNYVGLSDARGSRSASIPGAANDVNFNISRGSAGHIESSTSSSSSALQDNPACVQLLNHHYQHLGADKKEFHPNQENGAAACLELAGNKAGADHGFVHWNWPVIRTTCFWSVLSITVACFCVIIGMVATVPKKCYPAHAWHQGAVFYEIFPASFQDSQLTGDGIGDLRGVASRTEYFKSIGVTAIRLNSIFLTSGAYPERFYLSKSLTDIDPHVGTQEDLRYLLTALHSSNISLILDLPIFPLVNSLSQQTLPNAQSKDTAILEKITNTVHNHRSHRDVNDTEPDQTRPEEKKPILTPYIDGGISGLRKANSEHLKNTRTVLEEAVHFWFQFGIDGLYLKGLENYIHDPHFSTSLVNLKKIKNQLSNDRKQQILISSINVLNGVQSHQHIDVQQTFDLLDVYLEIGNGTQYMADEIKRQVESLAFTDGSFSWIHWNIGNMNTRRLSARIGPTLGAIFFQSLLPGTVSIFYGDEIGITESHDPHGDHEYMKNWHQLSPMMWINENTKFTPSSFMPWLPYGTSDNEYVVPILRNLTYIRKTNPSIYMNNVYRDGEVIKNCALRYVDDSIIIMERSYSRRNSYIVIYNDDIKDVTRDLTNVYYGGEVMLNTDGESGMYVQFKEFYIKAGSAAIIKLDK